MEQSEFKNRLETLGDQITVIGYLSEHCNDAGLKTILEGLWHELMNVYTYLDFQYDEGMITVKEVQDGSAKN